MATVYENRLQGESPGQRLNLSDVSWKTYIQMLDAFGDRRLRHTYDQGELEIMSPSGLHEWGTFVLNLLIVVLVEEFQQPFVGLGSMTMRLQKKEKGLEPDQCYWLQNEPKIRGKKELDFENDPPPDLIVEVDITRSSLDRMAIYESMGVTEVWVWDGSELTVRLLNSAGKYALDTHSKAFPGLQVADLLPFLTLAEQEGEFAMLKAFRTWLREQIETNWSRSPQTEKTPAKKKTSKKKT